MSMCCDELTPGLCCVQRILPHRLNFPLPLQVSDSSQAPAWLCFALLCSVRLHMCNMPMCCDELTFVAVAACSLLTVEPRLQPHESRFSELSTRYACTPRSPARVMRDAVVLRLADVGAAAACSVFTDKPSIQSHKSRFFELKRFCSLHVGCEMLPCCNGLTSVLCCVQRSLQQALNTVLRAQVFRGLHALCFAHPDCLHVGCEMLLCCICPTCVLCCVQLILPRHLNFRLHPQVFLESCHASCKAVAGTRA
jgi:hypothetical protein